MYHWAKSFADNRNIQKKKTKQKRLTGQQAINLGKAIAEHG